MNQLLHERYVFSGFMLDLVAGRFFADGQEVQLRPKSFALLSYMVRNPGRVVSKDELMAALWPDVTVTEDSLTQCVRDVRRALGADGAPMLRTVSRRGYILDMNIASAATDVQADAGPLPTPERHDISAAPSAEGVPLSDGPLQRPQPRRSAWAVRGVIAVLVVALLGAVWGLQGRQAAMRDAPLTLAIPRLANLTGDPEKAFLADAVPNNVANILGSSPLLRFTEFWFTRNSGLPGGVTRIAADLKVDLVLDGGIGAASPGFSFTGQLHDGPTGKVLATIEAKVPDGDLARLQYLIAQALLDEVAALTGSKDAAALDPGWGATSAVPDEYVFFLRGQAAYSTSEFSGEDDALRLIEPGLARYPQSIPLRTLKAEILANKAYFGPREDSWDNAQAAWAILSGLPEASSLPPLERWHLHFVRASTMRLATGDFEAGMREAEAAVALVPHAMERNVELSNVAAEAGHGAKAVEWVRATMREVPRPVDWQRDVLAWALISDGRPEEALAEYAQIQRFCLPCKVVALVRTGRLDQARNLVGTIRRERPWITIEHERSWPTGKQPFMAEPLLSAYLADLRKAGLPETVP